jgi:hypothetical protein
MRAEGGKVPPKKPAPPPPPKPDIVDILKGDVRRKREADLGLARGGKVPFGNLKKGALHKSLGIGADKKIPVKTLDKAADSPSPLMRKRANFALNARKFNHG